MRTRTTSDKLLAVVATVALLVCFTTAQATRNPASAATAGSISGRVVRDDGSPVAGATVDANVVMTNYLATTAQDGTYTIAAVPPGSYRLHAAPPTGSTFADQYWNGRAFYTLADPVTVSDSAATTGIDFRLPERGRITGTVSGPNGEPVGGARVSYAQSVAPMSMSDVTTAPDGSFEITGLVPDSYDLLLTPPSPYLSQWFDGRADRTSADHVSVASGASTTVAAHVLLGGVLSGTVSGGGAPLAGVTLLATSATLATYSWTVTTAADGAYRLVGLPTAHYALRFTTTAQSPWAGATAEADVVAGTETRLGDLALPAKGAVTGRVTDDAGRPVAGATAIVSNFPWFTTSVLTASDGTYRVDLVPPATYVVGFTPPAGSPMRPTWYRDHVSRDDADPVVVTNGATTAGIDGVLHVGGSISGRVTGPGGTALPGATVSARGIGAGSGYVATDTDGRYVMSGLPPGTYHVSFASTSDYQGVWYRGHFDETSADPVVVRDGTETSGIDAELPYATGSVTAIVRDGAGQPIAGAAVDLVGGPSGELGPIGTDASGFASFPYVPTGTYRAHVIPPAPNAAQWWNGRSDQAAADPIFVTAHAGIMVTFTVGIAPTTGAMAGRVTGPDGAPMADALVEVRRPGATDASGSALTGTDGTYTIEALPPANDYRATFTPPAGSGLLAQQFRDQPLEATGEPVAVTAGATTSAIDAHLARAAQLRGTVWSSRGPLANVVVSAAGPYTTATTTTTAADGTYRLADLWPGYYPVTFTADPSTDYPPLTRWADRTGGAVTTLDVTLRPAGGAVHGRITGPTGAAVANAMVTVWTVNGAGGSTMTDADGQYVVEGLANANYRISAAASGLLQEWFRDRPTEAAADLVTVMAGDDLTIDLQLLAPASLTGRVTGTSGAPIAGAAVMVQTAAATSSMSTDATGAYRVTGLWPGDATVAVTARAGSGYVAATTQATLAAGATTRLDVTLAAAVVTGSVTGKVTAPTAGATAGIDVRVVDRTGHPVGAATTDRSGRYRVDGVPPGSYIVLAVPNDPSFTPTYHPRAATSAEARTIIVRSGRTTTGVDIALRVAPQPPRPTSYADAVRADRPIAWWRLGEGTGTARDSSGNRHDGTYVGPTRPTSGAVAGDGAVALNLTGPTNAHVVIPDDGTLGLPSDLTIEAWVKPTASPGNYQMIVTKSPGADAGAPGQLPADYELWLDPTMHPQLRLTVGVGNPIVTADGTLATDRWTHLVVTRAGRRVTFYLDGVPAGAGTIDSGQVRTNTLPVRIGSRADERVPAYFAFRGAIDEVALYDHALTAAQVAAHAAAR